MKGGGKGEWEVRMGGEGRRGRENGRMEGERR